MSKKSNDADLSALAKRLLSSGPRKTAPTARRVRATFNGKFIVDTTKATHVWEHDYYPQYYFQFSELRNCSWTEKEKISADGSTKPGASILELLIKGDGNGEGDRTTGAIHFADDSDVKELRGLLKLQFGAMDSWLEEDVPIYDHPKDPYKRIDILHSSRPIQIKVDGVTVAESPNSWHLLETSLPTRYYLPLSSVDQSILRKSDLVTRCPYKGEAEYYNIVVNGVEHKELIWYYRHPIHESAAIAGLICFYNEKVDIVLDGHQLERPKTVFS